MNHERLNSNKCGEYGIQVHRESHISSSPIQSQMHSRPQSGFEGLTCKKITTSREAVPLSSRKKSHPQHLTISQKLICVMLVVACVLIVKKVLDSTAPQTASSSTATTTQEHSEVQKGRVRGIMLSPTKVSAMVGSKLVHEGDSVDDVKIVRIEKGRIHFERLGIDWSQTLQDPPSQYWK